MQNNLSKQQREIKENMSATLTGFAGGEATVDSPTPSKPTRRKNPRALIVSMDRIRRDPDQVRQAGKSADDPNIKNLASSLKRYGLLEPLAVRQLDDGSYEIIAGERRHIAATLLGWTEIDVVVKNIKDEKELPWMQLHENVHRQDLHPLDLAAAVKGRKDEGYSLEQIAKRMSKSKAWVQKALTVAQELSDDARKLLDGAPQGRSIDTAYAIATVPPQHQTAVTNRVLTEALTRQDVRRITQEAKQAAGPSPRKRGGRRSKTRPYQKTIRVDKATVTVKFRKSQATDREIVTALQAALQSLPSHHQKAA